MKTEIINNPIYLNIWFWVATIEAICIVTLLFMQLRRRRVKAKQTILNSKIDFNNIIDSSFNSKQLYDILKKRCHSDRFLDAQQKSIAENISLEISKNRHNIEVLKKIKDLAQQQLNIKI